MSEFIGLLRCKCEWFAIFAHLPEHGNFGFFPIYVEILNLEALTMGILLNFPNPLQIWLT